MNINQVKKLIKDGLDADDNFYDAVLACYKDREDKLKYGKKEVIVKFIAQVGESYDGATLETIVEIEGKNYAIVYMHSSWDVDEIYPEDTYEVEQKEVTRIEWVEK